MFWARAGKKCSAVMMVGILVSVILYVPACASVSFPSSFSGLAHRLTPRLHARETVIVERYAGPLDALFNHLDDLIPEAVQSDDYLRYNLDAWLVKATGYPGDITVTVHVTYLTTAQEEFLLEKGLRKEINEILRSAETPCQIIRAVHETICDKVSYDETLQSYSAVAGWAEGRTVCQGYALLMQRMLEMAGIPSRILLGWLSGNAHAWNLVQVEGTWFHLDVTNNDASGSDRFYLVSDRELKQQGFLFDADARQRLIARQTMAEERKPNCPPIFFRNARISFVALMIGPGTVPDRPRCFEGRTGRT